MVYNMKTIKTTLKNFIGTSYEVGTQIGKWILSRPDLMQRVILPPEAYPQVNYCKYVTYLTVIAVE